MSSHVQPRCFVCLLLIFLRKKHINQHRLVPRRFLDFNSSRFKHRITGKRGNFIEYEEWQHQYVYIYMHVEVMYSVCSLIPLFDMACSRYTSSRFKYVLIKTFTSQKRNRPPSRCHIRWFACVKKYSMINTNA